LGDSQAIGNLTAWTCLVSGIQQTDETLYHTAFQRTHILVKKIWHTDWLYLIHKFEQYEQAANQNEF